MSVSLFLLDSMYFLCHYTHINKQEGERRACKIRRINVQCIQQHSIDVDACF